MVRETNGKRDNGQFIKYELYATHLSSRLNILLKTFIKWSNSTDTPENTQTMQDRMQAQLAQCEFAVTKSDLCSRMMKQEMKNYDVISTTIEEGIEMAKTQIEQSKINLVLAKKIRRNRMEYDVLAKVIQQQPDRKNTSEKLATLSKELDDLEGTRKQLQERLEIRRKEFTVLMHAIQSLQHKLGDDNENDTGLVDQSDEGFIVDDDFGDKNGLVDVEFDMEIV